MLDAAGFQLPSQVHVHGFLTVDGEKMSKSKGTFIQASTYLEHLDPAYLRYYYAAKLTPRLDNLDLNLEEFVTKINSDLVGKVVNLASRTARFVESTGLAATYPDDGGLFAQAAADGEAIAEAYHACDYNKAMRAIMLLADRANQYVEAQAPWNLKKDPGKSAELQAVCTVALNLYRQIVVYLSPVLPRLAELTGNLLDRPIASWDESQSPRLGSRVHPFTHLMSRVDAAALAAIIEASRSAAPAAVPSPPTAGAVMEPSASETTSPALPADTKHQDDGTALANEPLAETISIDEFAKVDLRVARVLAAEEVPKAKKLLKLTLSLGGDQQRTVFAGIKAAYAPEQLVGRLVICVANLAPRQMTFGLSEGMVVAAGSGGPEVFLLSPDSGAVPGQRIH